MSNELSRRNFFKIAASTIASTSFASQYQKDIVEPYVEPPEEVLPGQDAWYSSTCGQCPAGCGIIVRSVNGRAKKIEGNPLHPLNRGKLCARGQAGLQVLYNPDRLKNAMRQVGGRGSRSFEPVYWTEALSILKEKITSLGEPSRMAFLGGLMSDSLYQLASSFLAALKAPPPVIFDLHCTLEGRVAASKLAETHFGTSDLPIYDIAGANVILSFGANLFETWMSPVAQNVSFGTMRQGSLGRRGILVQFEPRLSSTGASADEWIPVRPGAEGFVALAIGRIIVEERLGHVGSHRQYGILYQDVDIREAAVASEVPIETLHRLARAFADADRAVAIPGGYLSGQTNGFSSMQAVQALNLLVAQIGRVGGVFLSHQSPAPAMRSKPKVNSFEELLELIERMKAGMVDLLMVHGTNPMYELPEAAGISEALARVPYIVSFSSFVDETAVKSDLVLPDHTYLESWGYQVPDPGADRPVVSGQQPVVRPLYDTRATGDLLLELAAQIGGSVSEVLPWSNVSAFLQDITSQLHGSSLGAFDARTSSGFWALWRQYGGWWSEKEIYKEPEITEQTSSPLAVQSPEFDADPAEFPYHLYPYPSTLLSDGRGANLPWLQETPDPMTTVQWGMWVELHPETARKLDVEDDDLVLVESPHGKVEVSVVIYPGIRPDTVAIPIGQGHIDNGRYARVAAGKNPISLVGPIVDSATGALAWGATRVKLSKVGQKKNLARLESLDGQGRERLE